MTPSELRKLLGQPQRESRNQRREIDESWGCISVRYDAQKETAVEIGLMAPAQALYHGQDLLALRDPIGLLQADDATPMEYVGFLIFLRLGLTLTGFHDDDESQKALTLFQAGRWDHLIQKMKPFQHTPPF
jgi:hypothetical protein